MRHINPSTTRIEIRLTPAEKAVLQEYCKERQITVSDLVRSYLSKILEKAKND